MYNDAYRALTRHFYSGLFRATHNAEVSETTVVRSLAAVAAPVLLAAFWIVLLAPHGRVKHLTPWAAAGIHYIFVAYAFSAMGCITTLQWERLFPSRADFLILLPLPIRARDLFAAKLSANAIYLFLFLVASSIFALLLLPTLAYEHYVRAMFAPAIAVVTAALVSPLLVITLEGIVIVLTPQRFYRSVTPVIQTLLITVFLTAFLRLFPVVEHLPMLLNGQNPSAAWIVPLWFEALYETLLGGIPPTAFTTQLAHCALWSVPALLAAVAVTYPAAWYRRHRMALEGERSAQLHDARIWPFLLEPLLLRSTDQRAVFHFIRKTLGRLDRYHTLLALYAGVGLSLSMAQVFSIHSNSGGHLYLSVWKPGAQAALPILLFWTVAGLRVCFLLPEELAARWIFRVAPLNTTRAVTTTKRFVFMLCGFVIVFGITALALCGWSSYDLLFQTLFAGMFAMLLIDLFFFFESSIPFTRPPLPDSTSLPLTLAVFIFGIPASIILMLTVERGVGHSLLRMGEFVAGASIVHLTMHRLRRLPSHPVSDDAFLGETQEEFQTLGLSV